MEQFNAIVDYLMAILIVGSILTVIYSTIFTRCDKCKKRIIQCKCEKVYEDR